MCSQIEYEKPYERKEPENLLNIFMKCVYRQIKPRYPQKLLINSSGKHIKMFRPYTAECQNDLEVRCKNQPCGVATIYHPIQLKNYGKI